MAPPFFHLLLTTAWLLDNFMETNVEDWKEVMLAETKRPEDRFWFRGDDLKTQAVSDSIVQELGDGEGISRTIKKHVSSAQQVIFSEWRVESPLKPGEVEAANRTLCGLARATIKALARTDDAHKISLDSPKQVAAFFNIHFRLPPGLSKEQLVQRINECWQ